MSVKETFEWKNIAVICIALLMTLVTVMTANAAITLTASNGVNTSLGVNITEHGDDNSFLNFSAKDDGAITALNLSFPGDVTLPDVTDLNYSWVGLDIVLNNLSILNNVLTIENGSTIIAAANTEFSINITNTTYTWGSLSNGTYTFNLNTSNTPANTPIYLTIDGEPTVSANTYTEDVVTWVKNGTTLDFNASILDGGSGVQNATIDITSLNNTGIINLDILSGYWMNDSYIVSASAEGRHNITIVSYDNVGHVNNTVNFSVWVDNSAPLESATITHTDDAPTGYDNDTNIMLNWSVVSDAISYNVYRDGVFNKTETINSTILTGESDGTHRYNVSAVDAAGNEGQQNSTGVTVIVDTTPPLESATITHTDDAPAGYDNDTNVDISWNEVSDAVSYNLYRNGVFNISVVGKTTTNTTFTESDGTYRYNVSAVDAAGNEGQQNTTGVTVIVDTTAPTLTITTTPPTPSATKDSLNYTFEFSEDVTNFAKADITLNFSGTGATAVNGSTLTIIDANTYNLTLAGQDLTDLGALVSGENVTVSVDMTALTDIAGNPGAGATTKTWMYIVVDTTPPIFTMQYYTDAGFTSAVSDNARLKAGTYYLKITSNEALNGTPTVTIGAEGTANDKTDAATTLVLGNNYTYTRVIATDAAAIGSVLEDISVTGNDTSDNTATDVNPTNEGTKAIYTDTTEPTVSLTSTSSDPTNTSPIPMTATFSENVTGFVVGDITVGNGSAGNFVAINGTDCTFDVTPSTDGSVTVDVAINVTQDAALNNNTAATQFSIVYDATAPTVALTYSANPAKAGAMTVTATYSEAIVGTPAINITQQGTMNITAQAMSGGATVWTYTYTVVADDGSAYVDGVATVSLSTVADAAGNNAAGPTGTTFTIDTVAPTVALTYSANPAKAGAMTVTATYSEAIVGTPAISIVQQGTTDIATQNMSGGATVWTYAYTVVADNGSTYVDGTATVSLSTVADAASNNAAGPTGTTFTIDTIVPAIYNLTLSPNTTSTYNALITVSVNVSDLGGSGLATVTAAGGNLTHQSGDMWNGTISAGYGTNTVKVIATDNASNANATSSTYTGPTAPTTSSDDSSSSRGGRALLQTTTTEDTEGVVVVSQESKGITLSEPATTIAVDFTKEDIMSIEVEAKEEVNSVYITVQNLDGKPTSIPKSPSGNVHSYLNINVKDIDADNIAGADIAFKVEKKWLSQNNIVKDNVMLARFSEGVWQQLETNVVIGDDDFVYFSARTPGFSTFAIVAKDVAVTKPVDEIEAPVSVEEPVSDTATDVSVPVKDEDNGLPGFEAIFAVMGLLLVTLLVRKQEKN